MIKAEISKQCLRKHSNSLARSSRELEEESDNRAMATPRDHISYFIDLLEACRGIAQPRQWHPEGDVFQHTLQVVRWARREGAGPDLLCAALLHDVGKAVNSHGHEGIALEMLANRISDKTSWLIANHMRIWKLLEGAMMKKAKIEALLHHHWLPELLLLARWDKLGRSPDRHESYNREAFAALLQTDLTPPSGLLSAERLP